VSHGVSLFEQFDFRFEAPQVIIQVEPSPLFNMLLILYLYFNVLFFSPCQAAGRFTLGSGWRDSCRCVWNCT